MSTTTGCIEARRCELLDELTGLLERASIWELDARELSALNLLLGAVVQRTANRAAAEAVDTPRRGLYLVATSKTLAAQSD
ncbi:hypothetical protein [Gordonia sp. CPCC 205333]|uniref:hypothetical protein n=1 Tax=Gordonia sp. CPCC 205333 TaxID=3140790 RepID=UPI003AF381D7